MSECVGGVVVATAFIAVAAAYSATKITSKKPDPGSEAVIRAIKMNLARIDPKFAKIPIYESNRSETINKSVIYLCLRDDKGMFYSINTLMYVVLHELAHYLSKSYVDDGKGHVDNEEFKEIFSRLKTKAIGAGIYDPRKPLPRIYCGVKNA